MGVLDLYEGAYLCGGPDRVVRTALVALCSDGRVTISVEPPYRVTKMRMASTHPVETAMLNGIPSSGLLLRTLLRTTAGSPAGSAAVDGCAAALLKAKLLRRTPFGRLHRSRAGTDLARRLAEADHSENAEFAMYGLGALPVSPLRDALEELPAEHTFPLKPARRPAGPGYDDRGHYSPPIAGGGPYS